MGKNESDPEGIAKKSKLAAHPGYWEQPPVELTEDQRQKLQAAGASSHDIEWLAKRCGQIPNETALQAAIPTAGESHDYLVRFAKLCAELRTLSANMPAHTSSHIHAWFALKHQESPLKRIREDLRWLALAAQTQAEKLPTQSDRTAPYLFAFSPAVQHLAATGQRHMVDAGDTNPKPSKLLLAMLDVMREHAPPSLKLPKPENKTSVAKTLLTHHQTQIGDEENKHQEERIAERKTHKKQKPSADHQTSGSPRIDQMLHWGHMKSPEVDT